MMTVNLAGNKQTRIDAHRICKLMRKTKNALNECIEELERKPKPSLQRMRHYRTRAENKAGKAKKIFDEIVIDRANAIEEMGTIVNRFGAQLIPRMVINDFKNTMLAAQRAEKFCTEAIDNAKEAMRVEGRILRFYL